MVSCAGIQAFGMFSDDSWIRVFGLHIKLMSNYKTYNWRSGELKLVRKVRD